MKTSRLSLNDNKHFIEELLQLTNRLRRGVDSRSSAGMEKKMCVRTTEKKTLPMSKTSQNSPELFRLGRMQQLKKNEFLMRF